MPDITMPRLSDTMEDGVVANWLKQVGDTVTRGEVLAEIETDKALMELEAYDDGILEHIIAEPGTRVPIGEPIAILGDGSGSTPAASATPVGEVRRMKSSPLARKIARELDVDIATLTGTGPGGRITRHDVENAHATTTSVTPAAAAEPRAPMPDAPARRSERPISGDYDEIALTSIQRVSAERLTRSKQQAPHIYLTSAVDVTDLFAFRSRINETLTAAGIGKVSVNDLLVKAVAVTLRANPAVNVSFADDTLRRHRGIHLGVAVATPAGLLVPVIRDADAKAISAIAAETRDKAARARDRTLRAEEMSGGTFTISNLGMYGIEHFTAVINPPEGAILAIGAATDELQLDGDTVVQRKILRVTMSADHRAIDGAIAAQFLAQFRELVEHPLRIVT
ncbi:dihydrolipoyllysine-residue acetyltransferase component of pyruvate dehydrogenase complex [Nocardia nova SH22a]|uniref:Dihydrolipoamide acetyltransferase component of pyruvate dehydrogenase complex n=1 Tax=Nocardia nova SH22a TaxID=1415166 RepID=W5TLT4_9NOCA|nr:dihydrolipoamide acetyltransferase family protein [Nocardia nova]AHH19898.1 dihydrolipoyllysine-residue acetyltransferase component of pyruvate dehydrogenase complex [Nocardia nova SH22a]